MYLFDMFKQKSLLRVIFEGGVKQNSDKLFEIACGRECLHISHLQPLVADNLVPGHQNGLVWKVFLELFKVTLNG